MDWSEHLGTTIPSVDLRMVGDADGWVAPFCIIEAPFGYGEETWTDQIPDTVLAVPISGAPVTSEIRGFAGLQADSRRRTIALQSRGGSSRFHASARSQCGHFYVSDQLVERVAEGLDAHSFHPESLRHDLIMFRDDTLWGLLMAYAERSICHLEPASRIEMEARAVLVVERLIGAHHLGRVAKPLKGGLAPWQVRRTQEAMMARLDSEVGLDDLAAIAGCSPTHFSRAFKQSVGVPPFEWLHQRRMDKAKELLIETALPLAQIALAVGFSAQPQFTTAFGKVTGRTPGQWRRERTN